MVIIHLVDASHIPCNEHYFLPGDFIINGLTDELHLTSDCKINNSSNWMSDHTTCFNPAILYNIEAMAFVIEKVNNRNDILPNITLGFDIYDTCAEKNVAVSHVVDQLMRQPENQCQDNDAINNFPVIGVTGSLWSSITTAIAPLYGAERFHLPTISASSSDELSDSQRFPYFLRLVPPDRYQIQAIFDILKLYGWTSVSFVYTDDSYGRNALKAFKNLMDENICIAGEFAVDDESSSKNYDDMVGSILASKNSPVVILFTHKPYAKQFLDSMKRKDAVGKLQLIGGDAWGFNVEDDLSESSLDVASGLLKTSFVDQTVTEFEDYFYNHILSPDNINGNPWLDTELKTRITSSKHSNVNEMAAKRMDSILIFAYALDELISLKCPIRNASCLNHLKGSFDGKMLFSCMKKVNFLGYNRFNVSFDSNGQLRTQMYDIVNLQCDSSKNTCKLLRVGGWGSKKGLDIPDSSNITFGISNADGIPDSYCEGPPSYMHWHDTPAIVLSCLSSMGLLACVFVAVGYAININHDLIRASGPGVSYLILSGVFLSYLLVFALIAKPSKITCYIIRIGYMLCFTSVIGPLLVHANTIFRRYRAVVRCNSRPKLTNPSAEILFSLGLILIQVRMTLTIFEVKYLDQSLYQWCLDEIGVIRLITFLQNIIIIIVIITCMTLYWEESQGTFYDSNRSCSMIYGFWEAYLK